MWWSIPPVMRYSGWLASGVFLVSGCGGGLNQTSVTCPEGRTFLDGVCVSEPVADYVACVRAQGAQLGADKSEKISADAGYLGVRAGGAAELSETLQKKYSASDQVMMSIIEACNSTARIEQRGGGAAATGAPLAAHWKFDESGGTGVSDASGRGNTGAAQGNIAWVPGRMGGALKLDATSTVLVPEDASLHAPRAITLTTWFLLTEKEVDHPWRELLVKTNPKDGNWWGCKSGSEPDPNSCDEREYGAGVKADVRALYAYAVTEDRYQNGGQSVCLSPDGVVQFGKWHHFAAVISPKSRAMKVFLDGALMATCPLSEAALRRTSQPLHIGSTWLGMLDDMRIYSDELGDADVAALARTK